MSTYGLYGDRWLLLAPVLPCWATGSLTLSLFLNLFCQALVPGTKDFAAQDVGGQTEQVMKNLEAILEAAGSDFSKVVKCTILLADRADFAEVNAIYGSRFPENPPARATFAVKGLPLGALVEIDAVAME